MERLLFNIIFTQLTLIIGVTLGIVLGFIKNDLHSYITRILASIVIAFCLHVLVLIYI